MKARFFKKVSLGLVLSALPLVGGGDQETSNETQSLITTAQAEPLAVVTATNAATSATTEATPPPAIEPVPVPAPDAGKVPPPNIQPSSPLAEIVKLAQAGVDETVMLTYVSNAVSTFNLGSDEIIYLNDIGVADSVVTAMMQRDQALKQTWAETAQAQTTQAAAPAYVNPPQPEEQPVQVVEAAPAQPANVTYNYFYDTLSPYGTWIDVDGYGYCWQPTVVVLNGGWRPYCDRGRWLYTNLGWYWHSDYSWGWATFHYGRWFSHPRWGWCWYPGYVWGPSWVTWRYGGDYCGWAPLPPAAYYSPGFGFYYHNRSVGIGFGFGLGASAYTFVSWGNVCNSRPWHHRVPATRVTQIYNNTTIVNNVITGDNNTIINRGIPVDRVREHSRSEIRQVAVRETSATAGLSGRRERLERDGRTLLVHRANIPQSATASRTAARFEGEPRRAHTPTSGAGAAALIEPMSRQRPARLSAEAREQSTRSQSITPSAVTSSKPADNRTAVQTQSTASGNVRATSLSTRPPSNSIRSQKTPTVTKSSPQKSPPNLIVIGRRDSSSARAATSSRATHNWIADRNTTPPAASAPQIRSTRPSVTTSRSSSSYNRSTTPTQRSAPTHNLSSPARIHTITPSTVRSSQPRSVTPTYTAPRATPAPTYSVPRSSSSPIISVPRSSSSPSYSAPRPSSSRSYSTPRSSPSPSRSYSAPRHSTPTPSPSRAPSAPSSSSGRSDSASGGTLRKH